MRHELPEHCKPGEPGRYRGHAADQSFTRLYDAGPGASIATGRPRSLKRFSLGRWDTAKLSEWFPEPGTSGDVEIAVSILPALNRELNAEQMPAERAVIMPA